MSYLIDIKEDNLLIYIYFQKELYFNDRFKINILINNNIIGLKKIWIDVLK